MLPLLLGCADLPPVSMEGNVFSIETMHHEWLLTFPYSKGTNHMAWWAGKEGIREYLEEVNATEKVRSLA